MTVLFQGPTNVRLKRPPNVLGGAVSYKSLESILRHNLDQQPLSPPAAARSLSAHSNIRGAAYFE